MIDYQSFTPFVSFVGGCMIGLAVVILFLGDRRIAGVSGIFGEILTGLGGEGRGWRLLFVAGMLLAPWFVTGSGADGVGLFRTELQFLIRSHVPKRGELAALYAHVLDSAHGKPVMFRTDPGFNHAPGAGLGDMLLAAGQRDQTFTQGRVSNTDDGGAL